MVAIRETPLSGAAVRLIDVQRDMRGAWSKVREMMQLFECADRTSGIRNVHFTRVLRRGIRFRDFRPPNRMSERSFETPTKYEVTRQCFPAARPTSKLEFGHPHHMIG
jgi:hypothetical protein